MIKVNVLLQKHKMKSQFYARVEKGLRNFVEQC